MASRKSVAQVISNLTDADKSATERNERLMATIPAAIDRKDIPWHSVVQDMTFNVRDERSYGKANNPELYTSLKSKGQLPINDMKFSIQPDGKLLVVVGNVRYRLMHEIREERIAEGQEPGFDPLMGLVYTGLTREQETLLMADHMMSRALNEAELARELGEFKHQFPSMSYDQLSEHFGIEKNRIRRLVYTWDMPTVYAEFRKDKFGMGEFVHIGQKALDALHTAYLIDQDGGCDYRQEGHNFNAAWATVLESLQNPQPKGPKPKPSKPVGDILTQANSFSAAHGSGIVTDTCENLLRWSANSLGTDGKPVNLGERIQALKAHIATIEQERDGAVAANLALAEDVDSWTREATRLRNDIVTAQTEVDRLSTENEALKAEIATLKTKPAKVAK